MIDALDNMLKQVLATSVDVITDGDKQIGFEPPDDKWRGYVTGLTKMALNVYLADLKENRMLRSNERIRDFQNGMFTESPAPRRVDCHYLISAWSPATASLPTVEPTVDEHALLYKTVAALMDAEPFIPRQIYGPGGLPAGFPAMIADAQLPSTILPVEGFPKIAEFWGATKTVHWKPAIYLIVTLPVALPLQITGPMVTTRFAEYRTIGEAQLMETLVQIGGSVIKAADGTTLAGAWLLLEDSAGKPFQTATTDPDGHFTFTGLTSGNYQLRVRAQGFAEPVPPIPVVVPSPTGNYDVQLT